MRLILSNSFIGITKQFVYRLSVIIYIVRKSYLNVCYSAPFLNDDRKDAQYGASFLVVNFTLANCVQIVSGI
jgi:hypothetical protein